MHLDDWFSELQSYTHFEDALRELVNGQLVLIKITSDIPDFDDVQFYRLLQKENPDKAHAYLMKYLKKHLNNGGEG